MSGGSERYPDAAIEDIAYVSRSKSRIQILDALASGTYTRGELEAETGVARTTIGRIISELEERCWARRTTEGGYTATPTGKRLIAEFEPFVQSIDALQHLGDLVAWLPTEEVPIDLHHFADATVRRPEPADPMSTVTDFNDRIRDASAFHCLVGIAPPIPFEKEMRDGVVSRDLYTEHVITAEEHAYLLDHPERLPRWREYIDAGANVYRYDGSIPCDLFIFDEKVIVTNTRSDIGESHVGIVSENEIVLSWAHDVIETYRTDARRLDSTDFTVDSDE